MTRCVYLTFHGEPRGHAADAHHPPHESGPRIVRPALHPQRPGHRRRLRQPAEHRCPRLGARRLRAALRALLRAEGRRTSRPCSTRFSHPEFNIGIALVSTVIGLARHRPRLRLVLPRPRAPRHHRAQQGGPGRPHGPRREVLPRLALHRRHRRRREGPDRQGRLLVQPEGHRRRRSTAPAPRPCRAASSSTTRSTRGSSTPSSTARAPPPRAAARASASIQTGRVQQYAALLFAGAAVLAGVFIIVI